MARASLILALASLLLAAGLAGAPGASGAARCPERPACSGCGCKGGPGYRGPDGRCVGFKDLASVCGTPPETRCVFENAPGTGANRDCALGATDGPRPPAATPSPTQGAPGGK